MDTLQTVVNTVGSTALFWKWFLLGLVFGFPIHWMFAIKGDMSPEGKLKEFFTRYWADQVFAFLSYCVLVYAWHDGTIFTVLTWIGWKVEPFKLNMLTVLVAFFASAIMSSILTLAQWAGGKIKERFEKLLGKKIDSAGGEG